MSVWGWTSAKKDVQNMFTRSTAGANMFVCAFNDILMFAWCPQWCMVCCYLFFLAFSPIGPDRSRSVQIGPEFSKTLQNVHKLCSNWHKHLSYPHTTSPEYTGKSTCLLQTRLRPSGCLILTKYLWSEINMLNDRFDMCQFMFNLIPN